MESRTTVLLVHGAWHGSWAWSDVAPKLSDGGVDVATVDLPSSGPALGDLADDVRVLRSALDAIDGPVVVVAHSYGGIPLAEAAVGAANVRKLVYLAAFMLDKGESLMAAIGGAPAPWFNIAEDGASLTADTPEAVFYNDCSPEAASAAAAKLTPQSMASFNQALSDAAWKNIPSVYVVCDQDAALPVPAQESMSGRAGSVEHLNAGHSPALSMPGELAELILRHV